MATWRKLAQSLSFSYGTRRNSASELWGCADLDLTGSQQVPLTVNDILLTGNLPAKGSIHPDPLLFGAQLQDITLYRGPVPIRNSAGTMTYAAAIVLLTYTSTRFSLPRRVYVRSRGGAAIDSFEYPCFQQTGTIDDGSMTPIYERFLDQGAPKRRYVYIDYQVLQTGSVTALTAYIVTQQGFLYFIDGLPYLFSDFSINDRGNGQVVINYTFESTTPVQGTHAGDFGYDVEVPPLDYLAEYVIKTSVNPPEISIKTAVDLYDTGLILPGDVP